jgi:serine/threonine-protein kinase
VLRGHLDETPEPPPGLPPAVWELIRWCLAKDPADRPDAAELGDALRDLSRRMAGVPAMAAPVEDGELTVAGEAGNEVPHPSIRPAAARRKPPRNSPRAWKWQRPGLMVALIATAAAVSGLGGFNAWQMLGTTPPAAEQDRPAAIGAGPSAAGQSPPGGPAALPSAAIGAGTLPELAGKIPPLPPGPSGVAGAAVPPPAGLQASAGAGAGIGIGGGAGPVRAGVSVAPSRGRAEVAFGPWHCGDEYDWEVGHPVLARPCHALGPVVRVVAQIEAMPGIQTDVSLSVRDADSDEVVAGPYTCKGLMFTDFALKHNCGPVDLRPPRGGRYQVVESWEYTKRSLLPGGVARGPVFDW